MKYTERQIPPGHPERVDGQNPNAEKLLGQSTTDNEVVQAMKKHTDSQHIFHLKNEGTGCYGIMLKQRDYYIYAYLPDTEVFHNLPLSVASVIFLVNSGDV